MEINEDEANQILAAISCSYFEQGGNMEEDLLVIRIRQEFPDIAKRNAEEKKRTELWSVGVEKDPRVIAARKKVELSMKNNPGNYDKINEHIHELDDI
ncbi:MAG: hypothetical protein WC525_10330, partial [Candidatus Thermoplasmatota archaeon]